MRHERAIAADADACFRILVSEAYDAAVSQRNGLHEYRALSREPAQGEWQRRVMHASGRVPEALRPWLGRLGLGEAGELREEQWRSDAERRLGFRLSLPALGERVRVEGEVRLEPAGPGACRRVVEAEVRVRIPLLGSALERAGARVLAEVHDKGADVLAEMSNEKIQR
jgi:hypothetical protein